MGFAVADNTLKAYCNGVEAGQTYMGTVPIGWPGHALALTFFYRNQSLLDRASLVDPQVPLSFSNPQAPAGSLNPLDGHPLYGGLDNYDYQVRDTSTTEGDAFGRQWLYYRYNQGNPQLLLSCKDVAGQPFGDGCHLIISCPIAVW